MADAQVTDTPATGAVDVQDPLPEQDWTWRRTYTYALTLTSCIGVGYALHTLHDLRDANAVYGIAKWMLGIIAMLATYYMVAPSAEQIVKLIQAAKLLRAGVTTTKTATAETAQGGRVEVATTAGIPIEPAPAVEEEADAAPRSRT